MTSVLPSEREIVLVVLHGLVVVSQVEVRVAELAVDGAERAQVVRAGLDGRLEERHAGAAVARLAQPLALQRQLQAHRATIAALQTNYII